MKRPNNSPTNTIDLEPTLIEPSLPRTFYDFRRRSNFQITVRSIDMQ